MVDTRLFFQRASPPRADKRHTIGRLTTRREALVVRLLNGTSVEDREILDVDLSVPVLRDIRQQMLAHIPSASSVSPKGGLDAHYDFNVSCASRGHTELKITTGKPSPPTVLQWTPWKDTVQFLQGQLKSANGTRFLGDCGEPMFRAWFDTVIAHEAPTVEYEDYKKIALAMNIHGKYETNALTFLKALRTTPDLQQRLHGKWLEFETQWLSTHTLDHEKLEMLVRQILEDKDWWLCVSPTSAQWVEGFRVNSLTFVGAIPKRMGGVKFLYTLTLQKKSGGECVDVPMEFKFHWKNGGQAVQNLNYMLL